MEELDLIDMLSLAESVLVKSQNYERPLSNCGGPFKKLFCSVLEENLTSIEAADTKLFSQAPKFEPKTSLELVKPVKHEKTKKIKFVDDDRIEEDLHWTGVARCQDYKNLSLADHWENLPPKKPQTDEQNKCASEKVCITETNEPEIVHLLWTIAMDKLSLFSNSGDLKPCVEIIPDVIFTNDLTSLMSGLESSTFAYDVSTRTFLMRRLIAVTSLSPEALQSFTQKFIRMGNMCRSLELLANDPDSKKRGQTYQGLISGLKSFLHLYRTTIVQSTRDRKLLEMNYVTHKFEKQMSFVANLFKTSLPEGIPLLVYLCEKNLPVNTCDLHHLSVFLFRSAAQPFFRFLSRWAFQGKIDESANEFGMRVSQVDLSERSRRFWTHAFTQGRSEGFGFLEQLLPMIVSCGKTINFLKRNQVRSQLVNFSPEILTHPVELIMSPEQEEAVKEKYRCYYTDFKAIEVGNKKSSKPLVYPPKAAAENISLVEEKGKTFENGSTVEVCLFPEFDAQTESKYTSDFNSFSENPTDILSKVRQKTDFSSISKRPCFTPLVILMEKSVLLPLKSQFHVLTEKGIEFLLRDSNLYGHLRALRHYLFFGDSEFSRSLCSLLFREMEAHPNLKWGPGQLSSMVDTAIASSPFASKDPLAKNVSFYVDQNLGRCIRQSWLKLSYKTDWPVNIILTEEVLTSYGDIFKFILQIYKSTWGLQQSFMKLKNHKIAEDIQRIHLIRHQMSHFVLLLDSYVKSIIIEQSWIILKDELSNKATSIDAIFEAHTSYINRILFRCFLNKKAEPVQKLLIEVLDLVASFCELIVRGDWATVSGRHRIEKVFKTFQEKETFLSSVLWKLTSRGYQQHLQEFLLQLNDKNFQSS